MVRGGVVLIHLDYKDRRPIYEQIIARIEDLVSSGVLKPDEQLPSVRQLALELSINPNTIQRAYMELEKRNIIYSVKGKGNYVASNLDAVKKENEKRLLEEIRSLAERAAAFDISCERLTGEFEQSYRTAKEGQKK